MDFINGTTLFTLHIRKWSGKITAEDADYNPAGELPPAKLLERGRKPIFPPKALTIFDTLRKQAEKALLAKGVRFMKGFAVPNEHVDEVLNELKDLERQFHAGVKDVMDNFDHHRDNWIAENQEYESLLKRLIPKDTVQDRFEFEFYVSRVQPLEGHEVPEEKIGNQVLHEVCQICKAEADRLVARKGLIDSGELKDKLAPMTEKLDALSFGNSRVLKLLSEFKALEAAIPDGEEYQQAESMRANVITFLSTCSSLARLEAVINGDFSVNSMIGDVNGKSITEKTTSNYNQPTQTLASAGAFF